MIKGASTRDARRARAYASGQHGGFFECKTLLRAFEHFIRIDMISINDLQNFRELALM